MELPPSETESVTESGVGNELKNCRSSLIVRIWRRNMERDMKGSYIFWFNKYVLGCGKTASKCTVPYLELTFMTLVSLLLDKDLMSVLATYETLSNFNTSKVLYWQMWTEPKLLYQKGLSNLEGIQRLSNVTAEQEDLKKGQKVL